MNAYTLYLPMVRRTCFLVKYNKTVARLLFALVMHLKYVVLKYSNKTLIKVYLFIKHKSQKYSHVLVVVEPAHVPFKFIMRGKISLFIIVLIKSLDIICSVCYYKK